MSNIFYDIEVFKFDSLIVLMDKTETEIAHFWSLPEGEFKEDSPNGFEGLSDVITGHTLIGYNNYNYDDVVIYEMLKGRPQSTIKAVNDKIIAGVDMSSERKLALKELERRKVKTLDCMQQIDVSKPGLKKVEGNMGRSIIESSVPFDIDRPLTDAEKEEVLSYCRYDVRSTIAVYRLREKSYFETKAFLAGMYGDGKCERWNTTTIAGNLLLETKVPSWSRPKLPDGMWKNTKGIPDEVWSMWEGISYETRKSKPKPITIRKYDCDFTFGMGGLHGVALYGSRFTDVKLLDVSSMYPSIITILDALGKGTEKYRSIKDERIAIKRSDPVKSAALKLILNSVYGNLKNEYSILYNPMASASVCIYGQISLFDLCRRLYEAGYTLVNVNTDGVGFVDRSGAGNVYENIWQQWEKDYGLSLELDEFDMWIQKDVNNYVAVEGEKIKTKGGECNRYASDNFFSNNDARIIQMALVDKLLFDKDPLKTIRDNLDKPILFQYVLKAGSTYKGVFDEEGNRTQNVNRVFAAKEKTPGTTKLYKMRHDGGRVNFPDMPENMYVFNGDLEGFDNFRDIVDIQHYYNIVYKKLDGWNRH